MDTNHADHHENLQGGEEDPALERDMLELKLRAELGGLGSYSSGELSPEMERMFMQQVYDFEKNDAAGNSPLFGESLSMPAFEPWPPEEPLWEAGEEMVLEVLAWYKLQNFEVVFEQDYPASVRYDFLTRVLPGEPNHYNGKPAMITALIYENWFPNHAAEIEAGAEVFLQAFFNRDAEMLKDAIWRDQIAPETGPYDGQLLIDYLERWFAGISAFEKYDYSILETSFEWFEDGEEEVEGAPPPGYGPAGMGYAEGMVGYTANSLLQAEPIKHVGHFKFYFEWREGRWGIIYPIFPGLPIPPE